MPFYELIFEYFCKVTDSSVESTVQCMLQDHRGFGVGKRCQRKCVNVAENLNTVITGISTAVVLCMIKILKTQSAK